MIQIRPFQSADQNMIPDFVVNIQRGEFGVDVTIADQPDLLDIAGYFRHGIGEFWVAVDGDRIVGTIGLKDMPELEGELRAVAIRKMFVAATHRGREFGIAQRLLDTLGDDAAKHGVRRLMLGTTDKMKAAHRFYERNGFTRIAETDLPENFPRMPVDDVFYQKFSRS
ncbi:GNAT family N-acetyltransferase [soil metagenome]